MPERSKESLETELTRLRSENRRLQKENQALRQELGPVVRDVTLHELVASQGTGVTNNASVDKKIRLFRSLFRGREDVYPIRWENQKGRAGYSPACGNEWHKTFCGKPKVKCYNSMSAAFSGSIEASKKCVSTTISTRTYRYSARCMSED